MATRKIKDARDLTTNELIYFKGHAKATYMSNGKTVEDAINQIGTGGGGGIIVETDPVFSASPAASITEAKKTEWDNKMDKVTLAAVATSGSYNDLSNKPTIPSEQVNADWNATSGKAQILNKPIIPAAVTESTVSGWGFTKNTGTYSKPSGGIPKTDLDSAVQASLSKADTAYQSPYVLPFSIETLDDLSYSDNEGRLQTDADVFEKAKSAIEMGRMVVIRYGLSDAGYHICDATYNGDAISVRVYNGLMLYSFEIYASSQGSFMVEQYSLQSELVDGVNIATINGQSLTAGGDLTIEGGSTDGFVTKETIGVLTVANVQALYDGNDIYALPSSANGDEDDVIVSKRTLKTINGQSLIGSGDITISGGGGSSSGGGMNIVVMDDYLVDYAEPNTIYVITTNGTGGGLEVSEFIPPTNGYAEYVFIFQVGVMNSGFSIPEYVMWPNGQLPDVVSSGDVSYAAVYELNISASLVDGGEYIYKAVLTHFKEAQL